jgi:hypothetical protein
MRKWIMDWLSSGSVPPMSVLIRMRGFTGTGFCAINVNEEQKKQKSKSVLITGIMLIRKIFLK